MTDIATRPVPFSYRKPVGDRNKLVSVLGRTDRLLAMVQVVKEGGENNLHAHPHTDGIWLVLSGRVRFYGDGDVLLGEFGQHEGIVIPRGSKYWFEKVGDEDLQILAAQAFDTPLTEIKAIQDDRVNFAEMKTAPADVPQVDAALT